MLRVVADSSVGANWAVAVGTALLALATIRLAKRAGDEAAAVRREAEKVGEQVDLQRQQLEAANRAYVYPWLPHDWVMGTDYWNTSDRRLALLPVKNAGPSVARNVHGRIVWNRQQDVWSRSEITAGTVAPGDNQNARVSPPATGGWDGGRGYLRWVDLRGQDWVVFFRLYKQDELLVGEHEEPELIAGFNPDALDPADIAARARGD